MVNENTEAAQPRQWVLTFSCVDAPGIVHAISGAVVAAQGNIEESAQFSSRDTGHFFMRLEVTATNEHEKFKAKFLTEIEPIAEKYQMDWQLDIVGRPMRTLILASKATHCVNDLLYRKRNGQLPIEVPLILANHESVKDIAQFYGVSFEYQPIENVSQKHEFENRIREVIKEHDVELVVLARYMQILSPELVSELNGKAINIHHSFLPGFKGANPYRQAHERGVKLVGATAHFVTDDLDEGPIIEQDVARVDHSYSPAELTNLGQDEEARTLRRAVSWFARHRVLLDGTRTVVFQ